MDDTVQIKCPRCKSRFRERARKLTSGYSCQCVGCEAVIFFDDSSPKDEIKKALQAAKNVRCELRLEAEAKTATSAPFVFARR